MTAVRPLVFAAIGITLAFAAEALQMHVAFTYAAAGVAAIWLALAIYCAITGRRSPL